MSKLKEVIKELSSIITDSTLCYRCENCGEEIELFSPEESDLKEMVENLHELNKPAQYTVEIKQPDLAFEIEEYSAYMNGHRTVSADTIPEIKYRALLHINKIRGFLSLPPITVEQITFVEV